MGTRSPTDFDRIIGQKVRIARKAAKLSQQSLAETLRVTYQQIQKYENGKDRVGAARVLQISAITDHPIAFFFDFPEGEAVPARSSPQDVLADEGIQRLIAVASKIRSSKLLRNLSEIAETFAATPNQVDEPSQKEDATVGKTGNKPRLPTRKPRRIFRKSSKLPGRGSLR
jgi:transcriptional regulator with XRE-family HTH domain